MERNFSPMVLGELENLEKDGDSRKSAMKALTSHVKYLDSEAIPLFLARASEMKTTGSLYGECVISLYEVLARAHGPKIVPHIDNIMAIIIKTLTSSAEFSALHQACSRVVLAIARYGIDPTIPEDKKRHVIHSLCKPLSDSLLVAQENLSSGAALCLKVLVDLDNWRFASHQMVNEVCQRVVGALEEHTQITFHMGLVMALAKHNSLIVEAYARLLIHSGLQILSARVDEESLQRRMLAIQMVNFLMKSLDPRSICSEIGLIIEEMEKLQYDMIATVKVAAFNALQTARRIINKKGSKIEDDLGSITGSNCGTRDNNPRRKLWGAVYESHLTVSPESHTVNSFADYDSLIESPISVSQASWNLKSVNQKFLSRYEDGCVDVSLKDGFYPKETQKSAIESSEDGEYSDNQSDYTDEFAGLLQGNSGNGVSRSSTPSHQRSCYHINVDYAKIFSTPRKWVQSRQGKNDLNSDNSERQARKVRSPSMSKFDQSPKSNYDQHDISYDANLEIKRDENLLLGLEQCHGSLESVSSTADILHDADLIVAQKVVSRSNSKELEVKKNHGISVFYIVCGFYVVLIALLASLFWIDKHDEGCTVVPT